MDHVATRLDRLHGYYFEDLEVGMVDAFAKTITEADILSFAGTSGDTNPIHLNEEFAANSIFGGRIAHGILTASLISTVIGTKLPGPGCIYVNQMLKFKAPVRAGDTVTAEVEIVEIVPEKNFIKLRTTCTVGDKIVVDGEATIMVPTRADG